MANVNPSTPPPAIDLAAESAALRVERLNLLKLLNLKIKQSIGRLDLETVTLSEITSAIRCYNDHTRVEMRAMTPAETSDPPADTSPPAETDPLATLKLVKSA